MGNTLGKLQTRVNELEKRLVELQDKNSELIEEKKSLTSKLKYLEENFDKKLEIALTKAVKEVSEKYEKIIKEKDQRIFELEQRLNINSNNSSLPSSKDPIYKTKICNSRKETDKSKGGQIGHKKHKLEKFNDNEITEEVNHTMDKCPNCNSKNIKVINIKVRDEFDFKITIIKRRHYFNEYVCEDCGSKFKSEIPDNLHAENQYGSEVKSLAINLLDYGFISYNRVRKIICGFTNGEIDPSEGYLVKLQKKASIMLKDFTFDVKQKILESKLNYWDDTVAKIGEKDKGCIRGYTNGKEVLYKAHLAKDTKGMDEDGILQNLPSDCTVMHDHLLHNYCEDYSYRNIECNAHIIRKLQSISENTKHDWADKMKELLESTLTKRKEYSEKQIKSFSEEEIKNFDSKYDSIIKDGFKEYIEFKHKYEFTKEENLLEFMRDFKGPITEWVRDFSLPYSNNLCERLLRMLKTKMKISYQFQNLESAKCFANIMTYTETCGSYDVNKYEAIKRLFDNNPYTVDELINLKTANN